MEIQFDGGMIHFEDDEADDVMNLVCECGHICVYHGFSVHWGKPNWVAPLQCTHCDCKKFRIK